MPMWLNGTHPTVNEGEVPRNACVNFGGIPNKDPCCEHHLTIGVKNCGDFFVYYLRPPQACPVSYCAGTLVKNVIVGRRGSSFTSLPSLRRALCPTVLVR